MFIRFLLHAKKNYTEKMADLNGAYILVFLSFYKLGNPNANTSNDLHKVTQ